MNGIVDVREFDECMNCRAVLGFDNGDAISLREVVNGEAVGDKEIVVKVFGESGTRTEVAYVCSATFGCHDIGVSAV